MEARAVGIAVAQWATEARVGSDNDKFQLTKLNSAPTEHQILPICIYPHLGGCDKQGCRTPALKALSCSFRECQECGECGVRVRFSDLEELLPRILLE